MYPAGIDGGTSGSPAQIGGLISASCEIERANCLCQALQDPLPLPPWDLLARMGMDLWKWKGKLLAAFFIF